MTSQTGRHRVSTKVLGFKKALEGVRDLSDRLVERTRDAKQNMEEAVSEAGDVLKDALDEAARAAEQAITDAVREATRKIASMLDLAGGVVQFANMLKCMDAVPKANGSVVLSGGLMVQELQVFLHDIKEMGPSNYTRQKLNDGRYFPGD